MKTFLSLAVYILILLHFYSCNEDVFIDDFRSADTELTLDGNGDVGIIRFAASNWDLLEMYSNNSSYQCKIYDADGNLILAQQDPYLKGMGKIVCDDELTNFTIERSNPKELKITVDENVRSVPFRFVLVASNEYESQTIYVNITPSDRYVIGHITYSLDDCFCEMRIEQESSFVQGNWQDIPYPYLFYPYERASHNVAFKSEMPEAFSLLGEASPTIEIPSMQDARLVMNGTQAQYTSTPQTLPFSNTEQKEINIPPYTIQRITVLIMYNYFETGYTLYAIHPKTGKQRIITGTLQSKMPASYYIKRETIK